MIESGIYKIQNLLNGKLYIGSSLNVKRRLTLHKCNLRKNKHVNLALQNAFKKYGQDAFSFEKILVCSKEYLLMYEQLIIDSYGSCDKLFGYNIRTIASSNAGIPMHVNTRLALSKVWDEGGALERGIKYKAGNRYESFILLSEVKKDNGKRNFLCRCDCGKEWITSTVSIANGMVSCGCKNPQRYKVTN